MAIGERLKEAREQQNLSLEAMQETTKIQKRYLEAIENENFNILPGTFYARAFIKEYATALGLDPNELLEEYQAELPQAETDEAAHFSHLQRSRSRKPNNPNKNTAIFSFIPTIIVVILVIGIFFIVWFFTQASSTEESTESEQPQQENEVFRQSDAESAHDRTDDDASEEAEADDETDAEDTDAQENDPDPTLTVDEEGTGRSPESTLTLKHASDDMTVEIEVDDDSWLEVENGDGESLFSKTATAEDSPIQLDVSEADQLWFNVGNAPALDITIDGVTLDYPVDPDKEVFQKLEVKLEKESETSD